MKKIRPITDFDGSVGAAISSIQDHIKKEMKWREKAIALLRLVGDPAVDMEKLKAACSAHADDAEKI